MDVRDHAAAGPHRKPAIRAGTANGRGVLEGAFHLLDVLAAAEEGAGLSELARDAGMPKATTYRLLRQLADLGAVHQHGQRYFVGRRLALLGDAWQPDPRLRAAAREPVRLLSALTTTVVFLTALEGDRVKVITVARGEIKEVPPILPGSELAEATAAGRVLLTQRPDGDAAPPGFTLTEWRRAQAALRRSGSVAVDHHEVMPGVCCVAAPVRRPEGEIVASISALAVRPAVPAGLTELVLRASREITRNLGRT
ncbi:helix-turn-helix domain-containing protein [Microbispora hainanensis]|jgi:DNA-binding IclR family transcriptional regulator|uniref:Helix-turn-helix domain-containing protein n=1 Tax=Microbispora hainanensis TaxID=568844 RepID=A0ABZ1SQ72_9ACTN|nr:MULTISPECIES: helix-turn-helix domain-containing protein [Microbispora]NJP26966.1 helix-turn-helix domain-containing protein [Microbispora sp. CL1-1]TQS11616.1 helix-turn-helix domain-containing protein [Microbispora sp. SCL1-1]